MPYKKRKYMKLHTLISYMRTRGRIEDERQLDFHGVAKAYKHQRGSNMKDIRDQWLRQLMRAHWPSRLTK